MRNREQAVNGAIKNAVRVMLRLFRLSGFSKAEAQRLVTQIEDNARAGNDEANKRLLAEAYRDKPVTWFTPPIH